MEEQKKIAKKNGRPKAKIDWKKVAEDCVYGALGTEIAAGLGIKETTLYSRCEEDLGIKFSEFKQQNQAKGHKTLRYRMWKEAEKNYKMQIWLSKNWLGFKDKQETEISGKDGEPIKIGFYDADTGDVKNAPDSH